MFDGLNYITLYWLSGFAENKYEIWEAKKASIQRAADFLSFKTYLAWPVEEADEAQIQIRKTDAGLSLAADWFPGEEFELRSFTSEDQSGIMLMGSFLRENIFIHLRKL
jgi:hypothetical protein